MLARPKLLSLAALSALSLAPASGFVVGGGSLAARLRAGSPSAHTLLTAGAFLGPSLARANPTGGCPASARSTRSGSSLDMVLDGVKAKDIDGKEVDLGKFSSTPAVLVVNLASRWGATASNYKELVEMTSGQFTEKQLVVLGFPCNQFGAQEPGSDAEVKAFAEGKGAKPPFYLFSKIDVNGPNAHPLYKKMKEASGSGDLEWNFGKFLITKGGVKRYPIRTAASATIPDIQAAQ